MQKVILFAIFLFTISACTLPWSNDMIPSEHNFTNDYQRHVKAIFDNVDSNIKTYETILQYINPSWYDDSTIRVSWIVPNIGSGELSIHVDAVRETQLMSKLAAEFDIKGFLSLVDQMSEIDIKGWFIQSLESYYFHLDRADLVGSGSDYEKMQISWNKFMETYSPFIGKWVQFNISDLTQYSNQNKIDHDNILKTILSAEFDILSGWKKLRKILVANPPFRVTWSLGKQNDLYGYNVELDNSGTLALVENIMMVYGGTGLSLSEKDQIRAWLNMISLSGVLSIHAEQSEYVSFSGILTMSGEANPLNFDIAFLPKQKRINLSTEWKELFSFLSYTQWEKSEYMISIEWKKIMKTSLMFNEKDLELADIQITPPSETWIHIVFTYKNKKDFSFKVDEISEEANIVIYTPIDFIGSIQDMRLTLLSGSISPEKWNSIQLTYSYESDGWFRWKIQWDDLPGNINLDGHIKDDDILVNLSMMGMSSTLTHKNNSDKTFEWSIRLPVATLQWKWKTTKEYYESFSIELTSPVASASLDMKTIDGWLTGPLSVESSQFPITIPSIDIRTKKNKRDFSLQTDIGMGSGNTEKIHFEWDSHIDIRWDKKAKVKIPTEILPFSDVYSVFSGSDLIDWTRPISEGFYQL